MKRKKIIILYIILFITSHSIKAQLTTPKNLRIFDKIENNIPLINLPKVNKSKLLKAEKSSRHKVFKYGEVIDCNINLKNEAICQINKNGDKKWLLKIKSKNAYSLGLSFNYFKIPIGAELVIYNSTHTHTRGAFTYKNNKSNYFLSIAPIKGDEIIIEYLEPKQVAFEGILHMQYVVHDYKNIFNYLKKAYSSFGNSGECNININCNNNPLWQKLKHSVCKISYLGFLCSGALINNTANNGKAYVLTANHCINTQTIASQAIFYFNYESPSCENQDGSSDQSIANSSLISTPSSRDLDFALLELSTPPPPIYTPFYAGWNRNITSPSSATTIHHPKGDVKKISKANDGAIISNYEDEYIPFSHWWIDTWNEGTTEGGSSGAPLFDPNGLIIGDLTGGDASCSFNYNDYFQLISYSWDYHSESNQQLKNWLDPLNLNPISLQGYQPYDTVPSHLNASIKNSNINLKWNTTINSNISKYYIYRNGIKLDSTTSLNYIDTSAQANTKYSYWITAKFSSPKVYESQASNIVHTRIMNPLTLPFAENFEGQNTLWYSEKPAGSEGWVFKTGGKSGFLDTAFEGTTNTYFIGNSNTPSRLASPRFNFSTNTNLILSFYLHQQESSEYTHKLSILYKSVDSVSWRKIRTYQATNSNWEKKQVILPNLSNNYQIAFEASATGGSGIAIDSIKIFEDQAYINPNILANKDSICTNDSVAFYVNISNDHSVYWYFGLNAIPSSASGTGPHYVKYKKQASNNVKLIIDDTYITDSTSIVKSFNVPTVTFRQEGKTLISNINYGNQWYYNNAPIEGAIMQKYSVSKNGNYHVVVTNPLNCSASSAIKHVIADNINNINSGEKIFSIYPNPNNGNFTIKISPEGNKTDYDYKIINITGHICKSGRIEKHQEIEEITGADLVSGIYFIKISSPKVNFTQKIIINE